MNKKIVILFPCVGRRVSLLRAFRDACRTQGFDSVIIGTDTTENAAALQCCDKKFIVKPVTSPNYIHQITDIVKRHKVQLLIPTIDLDLPVLAKHSKRLAKLGCLVLVSSPTVVEICQDKRKTYRFLRAHGFDTPETTSVQKLLSRKKLNFPYFLKPWDGHASRGNAIVKNRRELQFYARRIPNCLVQEYIEGQEYTIDVLVDFDQQVRCIVPRLRMQTRSGEVSKSRTAKHPEIIAQSKRLIEELGAGPGVITIQCFLNSDEKIKFIEINPRFGGGVPLSIKAGAHFPRWILQRWMDKPPRIHMDKWKDGLTMLRYDEAIWLQQ